MTPHHQNLNDSILIIKQDIETGSKQWSVINRNKINTAFNVFSESLIAHMEFEDNIFYEYAADETGANGQLYRLISDHIKIRELIAHCDQLLESDNKQSFAVSIEKLMQQVEKHSIREEELMAANTRDLKESTATIRELLQNFHCAE
jgi:hypothetical protein